MSRLTVTIKKKTDGSAALSCRRPDGSVAWQNQAGDQGAFFPLHDLTHLAVETELGLARAFFGLVAEGWGFADFGKPWPRGSLPPEALASEFVVGLLDQERGAGARWTAAEFQESAAAYGRQHGVALHLPLDDPGLARIRRTRDELFARWRALPAGEALELPFAPRLPSAPSLA